jgi:hypothetical protein
MDDMESRTFVFPNLFYDVIVFLTPTLTFLIGVSEGLGVLDDLWRSLSAGQGSGLSILVVSFIIFFVGYEYGRLAETYSDIFVGTPLRFLRRIGLLKKDGDFGRLLSHQVELLGINLEMFEGRTTSKWTLYFYAMQNAPLVGADLLKRYAWEKLARSAGFSFFLLFIISATIHGNNLVFGTSEYLLNWQFGTPEFLIVSFSLYVMCVIDYYRRNAWNADLLITTLPVIIDDVRRRKYWKDSHCGEIQEAVQPAPNNISE